MNPQSVKIARRLLLLLIISLASTFLSKSVFTRAQTTEEREIEDKIPKHVPIKVKIRAEKEKAVKDLKNEKWLRDLELEVTNTSDKPIYFLELWIVLPEVISANNMEVGFPLRYGRFDFLHFDTRTLPEDVPIKPGERYVYKIPDNYQRGWEWHKVNENRANPTKIQIKFVQLSFGDGSGFNGISAKPYPYKKDQSMSVPCREGPKRADVKRRRRYDSTFRKTSTALNLVKTGSVPAG